VERVKVPLKDGKLKIRLLADKSILELYAQDGESVMTDWVFPTQHEGGISLTSEGGKAKLNSLTIHTLH
jgi:fructan beta-fructosidase